MQFWGVVRGAGAGWAIAERVVWERGAPASAHAARSYVFYTFVHRDQSNAVFYSSHMHMVCICNKFCCLWSKFVMLYRPAFPLQIQ